MHVHAGDEELTEKGPAKFWVRSDGSTEVSDRGRLSDREILQIKSFIKENYNEMYITWRAMSNNGFYGDV